MAKKSKKKPNPIDAPIKRQIELAQEDAAFIGTRRKFQKELKVLLDKYSLIDFWYAAVVLSNDKRIFIHYGQEDTQDRFQWIEVRRRRNYE